MDSAFPSLKHSQNRIYTDGCSKRCFIKPDAKCQSNTGRSPKAGCCCKPLDLVMLCYNNCTGPKKTNAAYYLCAQTHRITGSSHLVEVLVRQHNQAGTYTNKHIGPQPGGAVLHTTFQTDQAANYEGG